MTASSCAQATATAHSSSTTLANGQLPVLGGVILLTAGLAGNLIFGASTLALPAVEEAFGLSAASGSVVVALYSVGFAASLVLGGRLGDRYGRRTITQWALGAVIVSSIVVACAPTVLVLNIGRVIQGIATGLVLPQVLSTIQHSTTGTNRARWSGAYAGVIGGGTAIGQIGAGLLIAVDPWGAGWRLSYALVAAVTIIPLALSALIPQTRGTGTGRLDFIGAALLGLGVTGIVLPLGLSSTISGTSCALCLLGAFVALAALARWERRIDPERALLPPTAMRSRPLLLGLALTFLFFASYGGFVYYFTVTAHAGLDLSALQTALVLFPFAVGFIVMSLTLPLLLARRAPHIVMMAGTIGQILMLSSIGVVMVSGWPDPSIMLVIALFIVLGIAQAMMYGPLIGAVMSAVPEHLVGLASGLFSTFQQLGFALGIPVFALVTSAAGSSPSRAFAWCVAAQVLIASSFGIFVTRMRRT